MDVWISKVTRLCKCSYCPKMIEMKIKDIQQFMVVGKYWTKKKEGEVPANYKHWCYTRRWHTDCWIEQGVEAVKAKAIREPKISTRGRSKLPISKEDKAKRLHIQLRRGSIIQRIEQEVAKPTKLQDMDKLIHLGEGLEKCRIEIEKLGGVPKKW